MGTIWVMGKRTDKYNSKCICNVIWAMSARTDNYNFDCVCV